MTLRSEAIPVNWVLRALGARTGVSLQAVGRAGDERLVAFVPEAPLAEIMERIADLYRLEWTRVGKGAKPTYRLEKRPSVAREEQALRDRALAQLLDRLSAYLRGAPPPKGLSVRGEKWATFYPELIRLLARRGSTLTREGYIRVTIGDLPAPERQRIVQKLGPILQESDQLRSLAFLQIRQEEIGRGVLPGEGFPDQPPSDPLESVLTADLQLAQGLQVNVGLRTTGNTAYHWSKVEADDLQDPAQEFYQDRDLHVPEQPGGGPAAAEKDGPLAKLVEIRSLEKPRPGDWIGTLGRISDAAGVPLYADCYANYLEGGGGHPRSQVPAVGRGTVTQFLDSLCYPAAAAGRWKDGATSFWWRRDGSALIRSRRWIWEDQAVLPSVLLERAIGSVRRTGTLSAADLPGLAGLTFFHLQQGDSTGHYLEDWRRAVRVPARLSLPALQALFGGGLAWNGITADDQTALTLLLPGKDVISYEARVRTDLEDHPAQGGTVLNLSLYATPGKGSRFYLPLPGTATVKGLPGSGLVVSVK